MPQMSACKGGLGAYPSENLKKSEVAKTCFPLFWTEMRPFNIVFLNIGIISSLI